jgi:hypothetical protein
MPQPDRTALVIGGLRLASGVSFLVAPERANRLWGDRSEPRGRDTRGWFLASGGADAADLVGGLSVHKELPRSQQLVGLGGAAVGVGVGLWGATRRLRP